MKRRVLMSADLAVLLFAGWSAAQAPRQMEGRAPRQAPHDYGEYFDFLKTMGVEIYGNHTMMLLYKIDPARVASSVTPIPLDRMVQLFALVDRLIVY